MSVNAQIILPNNVQVADVADVIGILSGKRPLKKQLQGSDGLFIDVEGVEVNSSCVATLAEIKVNGELSKDAEEVRKFSGGLFVLYHFEPGDRIDGRLLMPRSTTFWIAIGKALVKFFGGTIDYNDCDETNINFRVAKKSRNINSPSDGKAWNNFQRRKLNLKALTKKDFDKVRKYAAY